MFSSSRFELAWRFSEGCDDCAHLRHKHDGAADNPCLACEMSFSITQDRPFWAPVRPLRVKGIWPVFVPLAITDQAEQ
jgi:hypothetical protein